MALDGEAAAQYMHVGQPNAKNACLYTVWLAYGSPHTIGPRAGYTFPTAIEAFSYTTKRHTDRNPPRGAAVWFGALSGPRYAGDAHWQDGDVCVSLGAGNLGGTDHPWGQVGQLTIAQREAETGRKYLGWTEDFIGNDINMPGYATAATVEVDMLADERNALMNIYNAIFFGGPSMEDDKKSVSRTLAELQANVGALQATVQALAAGVGEPAAVQAAAQAGAEAALQKARIVTNQ